MAEGAEQYERIPAAVAAVIGNRRGKLDGLGKSGAQVVLFEDYVLKIRPENDWDTEDTKILRWLEGKVPAPRVAAHAVQDGQDWLLMTRVRGWELCKPEIMNRPTLLLDWLKENLPPQDRVVTHGDFCLPNLFTDGKRFTGFIDVGKAGAGDRWMDLALGWRSLKHNSDGHYGKIYPDIHPDDLFRAAGVPKDEEKLRYYILLDELN